MVALSEISLLFIAISTPQMKPSWKNCDNKAIYEIRI